MAEVGYGLRGPRGLGVLTPYTAGSWADDGDRTLRAGARWQVAPDVTMGLEATRSRGGGTAGPDAAIQIRANLRF